MKLTLSQIEIEQAVINYLLSKGLDFGKTINWDVEWDQDYDTKPTNVECSVNLL
jgi:hypothetical protein